MANSNAIAMSGLKEGATGEAALSTHQWGMISFLFSEVAFFSTLLVTYLHFIGKDQPGPTPAVLSLPLAIGGTVCLLASSATVHLAEKYVRAGAHSIFLCCWFGTIALGAGFLLITAYEWYGLIEHEHLKISTNMFGTTFYTLVGFHAAHVTGGVIAMLVVLGFALSGSVTARNHTSVQMVSWYWHFVDVVWIAVFTVVYWVGR